MSSCIVFVWFCVNFVHYVAILSRHFGDILVSAALYGQRGDAVFAVMSTNGT